MRIYRFFAIPLIFYSYSIVVTSLYIENNAYKGISVSFSAGLQEQNIDFQKLKAILTKSSEFLYNATRRKSYFKEFIISSPSSWTEDMCNDFATDAPGRMDVYITDRSSESSLRAQHSGGCGTAGDVIYMSLNWLQGDTSELARQFVQQWSIYRYGVFEEDPIDDGSCYRSKSSWSPTGCYNTKVNVEPIFENGIPVCSINPDTFTGNQPQSSLMFTNNFSKALDFCGGSTAHAHNPAMPTLHNALCGGETVWSVIENSEDFKNKKNPSMDNEKPPTEPIFKCYREKPVQLTFAIQNNTSGKDLTDDIVELRYALYHFLSSISLEKLSANVVMFSDKEDVSEPLELDLTDDENLIKQIISKIKTERPITKNCVSCGFKKALNASQLKAHIRPIVVLILWESAMASEKPSQLMKDIKEYSSTQLNLVVVEDTSGDAIPVELNSAIRSTGGRVYFIPMRYIYMATSLLATLSSIVKNPLQVEDNIIVVHKATYINITKDFVDSFATANGEVGRMNYFMYCDLNLRVQPENSSCVPYKTKAKLDAFKCTEDLKMSDNEVSLNLWKFSHKYDAGTVPPNCATVAMEVRSSPSQNSFTLRGWLNNYEINEDSNTLIIYAEIFGNSTQQYEVQARISGPNDFESTLELKDNGNGDPDVKRGDGIYSRYFIPRSLDKGAYIVTISAEMNSGEPNIKLLAHGKSAGDLRLRQTKTIGFFSVMQSVPDVDVFPPNRIGDLKVISINHDNRSVMLQWTAPGNDYDNGIATAYEIRYTTHPANLMALYFNTEENLLLIPQNKFDPSSSGTTERNGFIFPDNYDVTYYIAVRATDEYKNAGKISNIIQLYINKSQEITGETSRSTEILKLSSITTSIVPEVVELSTTIETLTETESKITSTISPKEIKEENFFDRKFIIVASTAGGILLLIVLINIIVCCCCIKRRKEISGPQKVSRETFLRPPYNLNIAYQQNTPGFKDEEEDIGTSMSTLVDQSIYTRPHARNRTAPQRYSYHTSRSLSNKAKSQNDNDLGFNLVQTLPAYATSSLSRFSRRLNADDSETDSKTTTAEPQSPANVTHIYPLGNV